MRLVFHREFEKRYKKLKSGDKLRFKERASLFLENPYHPVLNNHALRGKYSGFRSINISGDLRAIYELIDNDIAFFITVDTHSKLYN